MIEEVRSLVDGYKHWLRDKTALREVNNHVEITTPFLDRHNDYIQIYAQKKDGGFLLSDGGATIDDLEMSGCSLDTPKRQDLLRTTLAGFGIALDHGALHVQATAENFSLRKHNLIQAMLAVNDLFYLAQPYVESIFFDDVLAWLDERGIRYTPNVSFRGKSGYEHRFHLAIPKSQGAPERLVQAITNPTKDAAMSLAFAWLDTREVRPAGSKAFAVLNDREKRLPPTVSDALTSYEVTPVSWSVREKFEDQLAA
jgi:hypothetical protein